MTENKRAETAHAHDDHALIDPGLRRGRLEAKPGESGVSGGHLQRNIASRAEQEQDGDESGVTRLHGADKSERGDRLNLPNFD